jgi:hypothetical protein
MSIRFGFAMLQHQNGRRSKSRITLRLEEDTRFTQKLKNLGSTPSTDPDDDNDGLLDTEEDKNGDGRIEGDTNNDRIWDDNEDWKETNSLNDDTDGDDVNDKEDYDPLNPNVWEKPSSETPWLIIALLVIVIVVVVFIVVLLLLRKRKGKTAM